MTTATESSAQQCADSLASFLLGHPRLLVLTGAGISAPSGIPTYRNQQGTWQHNTPITEQAFLRDANTRRRYWARSWYGWPVIRDARPNDAHLALAILEQAGYIELLVTQNVDGLHQQAGSRAVVDLHGRVDRVRCLRCTAVYGREDIQHALAQRHDWPERPLLAPRPDGDMDIDDALIQRVTPPPCTRCDGDLMPDVVFFGGRVPPPTVNACHDALQRADALLAIGTSLMVYSGFRFCRRARELGKPVAIINPGVTRADDLAQLRIALAAAPLLTLLVERLVGRDRAGATATEAPAWP